MKDSNFKLTFALLVAGIVLLLSLPGKADDDAVVSPSTDTDSTRIMPEEDEASEEEIPATILNQETGTFSEEEDSTEE